MCIYPIRCSVVLRAPKSKTNQKQACIVLS